MIIALAALATSTPPSDIVIVRAERLVERPTPDQRLSSDDLDNQTGLRLDEALRIVPGIGLFRRTASGAANATIQGLSLRPIAPNGAGRALVSLDGVPQNDPFGGWVYWTRYDPLFLDQVAIKRGGAGAGYGPMALTGVLDLTEARGMPNGFATSLGSQNTWHLAGRQSVFTRGAVFTAMAAFEQSDGAVPVARSQRGPADLPADFQAMSFTFVTDLARDNGAWSFRGSGFSERKGAGLRGGQSDASGLDISVARRFEGEWGQSRALIYAQGRDFSNQTVAVTGGRLGTTPALDQVSTPSSALGGSVEFIPPSGKAMPRLVLDWRQAQGETRELFRFISGDFTRTRLAGGTQKLAGFGLFLPSPLITNGAGLAMDGGLRVDYWANTDGRRLETNRASGTPTLTERPESKSGSIVTGRLSLAQVTGPFGISVYRTFRPPTLNELHRPFRVGNDVTEANAALVPETLIGLDVDFRASRAWAKGTFRTSITVYVNQLVDPIANVTVGIGPGVLPRVGFLPAGGSLRERRNVGQIDASGIEARIEWDGGRETLNWSIATHVSDAQVDGGVVLPQLTGKRPAQVPNWSAVARIGWPIVQNLGLDITVRGESARFEDDLNLRKLSAYGALDMRLAWQLNDRLELAIAGENMLDTSIETALAGDGVLSLAQKRVIRIGIRFGG